MQVASPPFGEFELAAGKLADLTVLSADIMTIPEQEILKTRCVMTIIGGEMVFSANQAD